MDGFVAGTWKPARRKGTASLHVEPFAPLSLRTRQEILAEAEAVARFAEPEAGTFEVRIGS